MPIMPDSWIREQAQNNGMITPFSEKQNKDNVISYGLSSYGYDCRLSDEFMIFTNVDNAIVDPKSFNPNSFVERKSDVCSGWDGPTLDSHGIIHGNEVVNARRYDDSAYAGYAGQRYLVQFRQFTHHDLALHLHTDREEKDSHQSIIYP